MARARAGGTLGGMTSYATDITPYAAAPSRSTAPVPMVALVGGSVAALLASS